MVYTREQRSENSRKAALKHWSDTTDPAQRRARTEAARAARLRNLKNRVDADRKLSRPKRAKLTEEARRELCRQGGLETQRQNRLNAEIAALAKELIKDVRPLTPEQRAKLAAILNPE